MPEHAGNLPLRTTHRATFALPCAAPRALAYLGDPAVVLAALPSVERVIQRQQGTFRITLAPVQVLGVSLRPAAEVIFTTEPDRVRIMSIEEEPNTLQAGEIATRVTGLFILTAARTGCMVHASLAVDADVPAHVVPPLLPRRIVQRTAETVLNYRMKQEIVAMTRMLVQGYPVWEAGEAGFEIRGSE
jgi:hypothetical protein